MIKIRLHAIAGIIGFLTILTFWLSTLISETPGAATPISRWSKTPFYGG
jgi:hypothetical protein